MKITRPDKDIKVTTFESIQEMVNHIKTAPINKVFENRWSLMSTAKENGIRATFSYRCIITTTKLMETGMNLKTILTIAIFKGLDKDTVNTFRTDLNKDGNTGKFYYALRELQGAA